MGKIKFDLETKIKACKEYEKGKKSFEEIGKEINAGKTTVTEWYEKYREKGPYSLKAKNLQGKFFKRIQNEHN